MAHPSPRILAAIDLLAPRAGEHLLEIGCGTGQAIEACLFRIPDIKIHAIDRSTKAVARVRAVNAAAIARGQLSVELADIDEGPVPGQYDRAFAIRVNSFWTRPGLALGHIHGSLKSSGSFWMIYDDLEAKIDDPIRASFSQSGFAEIHAHRVNGAYAWVVTRA